MGIYGSEKAAARLESSRMQICLGNKIAFKIEDFSVIAKSYLFAAFHNVTGSMVSGTLQFPNPEQKPSVATYLSDVLEIKSSMA